MNLNRPVFRMLSDEKCYEIHLKSLELLERVGMLVQDEKALSLLKEAGCFVSSDNRVKVPPSLIKKALSTVPERVVLCNRDGERVMFLESDKVYFGTGSDTPFTIDPFKRVRRKTVKEDVANWAKLCDALPNIDFVMSMGIASDVPSHSSYVHQFEAMVKSTRKPIVFTANNGEDIEVIYRIAVTVAGSEERLRERPFILLYAEPIEPLICSKMSMEKLLFCAERGIPALFAPGILTGGTAVVTSAGALVQANAEMLMGILISQLKREGAPMVYGGGIISMDMRSCIGAYSGPEQRARFCAMADMAHFYRLPVFDLAGASDSLEFDAQAGAEATFSLLLSALSGANLIHDVGYLESGLTSSGEMILFCDEIIDMVKRFLKGIEVNEETLAIDVMERVGPGGHFLQDEHTLRHFKDEIWHPRFLNRDRYEVWMEKGGIKLEDKLNKEVREILRKHQVPPLPDDVSKEISKIVSEYDKCGVKT